jgi:hypothetical protein
MKYHIFVGSTLDDLKNERREVLRVIMELGHVPVMTEYFSEHFDDLSVKNREQLLAKTIEGCDYFIAVAAHKYASAGGTVSPLETEYNIARRRNIPVISLVIDDKARWKSSKKEKETALVKKLENFKQKLRSCPCETWLNSTDLYQKCMSLLVLQMNLSPQSGWVRADQAITPSVANELSRLSTENEQFRRRMKMWDGDIFTKLREQMKKTLKVLALNKVVLSFYYNAGDKWENSLQFRYLRLFKLLVPELAPGKTTAEISRFLGTVLNPDLDRSVRKDYPTPSNTIKKIMADFSL